MGLATDGGLRLQATVHQCRHRRPKGLGIWVLIRLWKRHGIRTREHETCLPWVEKESRLGDDEVMLNVLRCRLTY